MEILQQAVDFYNSSVDILKNYGWIGFLALVFSAPVIYIARQLWKKRRDKIVEGLDKAIDKLPGAAGSLLAGWLYRARYCRQVVIDHANVNLEGLTQAAKLNIKLDQVFIEMRISADSGRFDQTVVASSEVTGKAHDIWFFLNSKITTNNSPLVIIGPVGYGKSTLMQHVALVLAGKRHRRYKSRAAVPILLQLRDHAKTIAENKNLALPELIDNYLKELKRYPNPPVNWFEKKLKSGKCIILLDGLDEAGDKDQRKLVAQWVDEQVNHFPGSQFVLTSRPEGYKDNPLKHVDELKALSLTPSQQAEFIKKWFYSYEFQASRGKLDASARQHAELQSEELQGKIAETENLREISDNPMLLTIICLLWRINKNLPEKRAELYEEVCNLWLGGWWRVKFKNEAFREINDPLSAAQKRLILEPLAAHIMEQKILEIDQGNVLEKIKEPTEQLGKTADEEFLHYLQRSGQLFLEREVQKWGFAHKSFQEYLCAAHWIAKKIEPDWSKLVNEGWWWETIRLYASLGDASAIIQACLNNGTTNALALAAECRDNARLISDTNLRGTLNARLLADLESEDSERRKLAAEVKLLGRLRKFQTLDSGVQIDSDYLSNAEYQLFLDERLARGNPCQPDHWTDYKFPKGEAQKPVRGLRAKDAANFCEWLNEGSVQLKYRLPTPEEANRVSGNKLDLAAWCYANKIFSLTVLKNEPEIRQKLEILLQDSEIREPALDRALDLDLDRALRRSPRPIGPHHYRQDVALNFGFGDCHTFSPQTVVSSWLLVISKKIEYKTVKRQPDYSNIISLCLPNLKINHLHLVQEELTDNAY